MLTLLAGLVLFTIGFALSFRLILLPALQATSEGWNGLMSRFFKPEDLDTANHLIGGAALLLGFYLLFIGARGVVRRLMDTISPGSSRGMVNTFVRRQMLSSGPRIVVLGGGTGLSTLLRGLKQHTSNITAIVTVTDDGGSSGRLVQELGILPPGDIRSCLVALADAEKLMTDLFQYRFKGDTGSLSGHSMGNLLIAALIEHSGGDIEKALRTASDVLNIRGRVVPATLAGVRLRALMENGLEICGETNIVNSGIRVRRLFLDPPDVDPLPEAIEAIAEAQLICVGPGSVYTSVIPNLLVPGIAAAVEQSKAKKVYICNVMTQHGETDSFTAAEHAMAILANVEPKVVDYVMVNTAVPSQAAIEKYREFDQYFVEPDSDRIRAMGLKVLPGNYMSESDYVRHDPVRLAARLMELIDR